MKKAFFLVLSVIFILFYINKNNNKRKPFTAYSLDNPSERVVWERIRLADPSTGEIPRNIHKKERIFAKTLPISNSLSKNNWVHRGPYNVGGRTRAFALDVLNEDLEGSILDKIKTD